MRLWDPPADEGFPFRATLRGHTLPFSNGDYPAAARRRSEQGIVRVLLTISAAGKVDDCTVVRSSGSAALDAASCRAARRGDYLPALAPDGRPTVGRYGLQFAWVLPRPE